MATVTSKGHPPISGCATVWRSWVRTARLRADGRRSGNDDQLRGHAGGADRRHDRLPVASAGVPVVAANTAPTAGAVSITGVAEVGQTLTGQYNLQVMATVTSKGHPPISGCATVRRSWVRTARLRADGDDLGTTISFEVTPVALTGVHDRVAGRQCGCAGGRREHGADGECGEYHGCGGSGADPDRPVHLQ